MANKYQPKTKLSETIISTTFENSKDQKNYKLNMEPGTSYEVFRNNTTAIEVIVKEVTDRSKKRLITEHPTCKNTLIEQLNSTGLKEINERLANEVIKSNETLLESKNNFKTLISVMSKQLDEANSREIEIKSKYLNAQLENEKLKTLLEYKTNLVKKFKREIINLKRMIKLVMKDVFYLPTNIAENVSLESDIDYDEFEKELKNCGVKFKDLFEGSLDTIANHTIK